HSRHRFSWVLLERVCTQQRPAGRSATANPGSDGSKEARYARSKTIRKVQTCASRPTPRLYLAAMPECSICRRSYDERFQVFIPPHPESFDRVECARQAARIWGLDPVAAVPVILHTIVAGGSGAGFPRPVAAATAPPVAPRRAVAALAALAIAPGQAAVAAGVGLFAAGSVASVYLAARPAGKTSVTAAPAHPEGLKVDMPSAAQPDAPAPLSVAPSEATEHPSVAANRPAHVTLHPTAVVAAAPRVHAVLSSRDASRQLASRRVTGQSPAEPSSHPTPAAGPPSTSRSPKSSATGTGVQTPKKEP